MKRELEALSFVRVSVPLHDSNEYSGYLIKQKQPLSEISITRKRANFLVNYGLSAISSIPPQHITPNHTNRPNSAGPRPSTIRSNLLRFLCSTHSTASSIAGVDVRTTLAGFAFAAPVIWHERWLQDVRESRTRWA